MKNKWEMALLQIFENEKMTKEEKTLFFLSNKTSLRKIILTKDDFQVIFEKKDLYIWIFIHKWWIIGWNLSLFSKLPRQRERHGVMAVKKRTISCGFFIVFFSRKSELEKTKSSFNSSSSDLDRTARALREEFDGYFSFSRLASAGDSPLQKQTFWKILHHMVVKIYFCQLSCEQSYSCIDSELWAVTPAIDSWAVSNKFSIAL